MSYSSSTINPSQTPPNTPIIGQPSIGSKTYIDETGTTQTFTGSGIALTTDPFNLGSGVWGFQMQVNLISTSDITSYDSCTVQIIQNGIARPAFAQTQSFGKISYDADTQFQSDISCILFQGSTPVNPFTVSVILIYDLNTTGTDPEFSYSLTWLRIA